jgi:hypothetical protein
MFSKRRLAIHDVDTTTHLGGCHSTAHGVVDYIISLFTINFLDEGLIISYYIKEVFPIIRCLVVLQAERRTKQIHLFFIPIREV